MFLDVPYWAVLPPSQMVFFLVSEVHCTQFETKHSRRQLFTASRWLISCDFCSSSNPFAQSDLGAGALSGISSIHFFSAFSSSISGGRDLVLLMASYTCSFLAGQSFDRFLDFYNVNYIYIYNIWRSSNNIGWHNIVYLRTMETVFAQFL